MPAVNFELTVESLKFWVDLESTLVDEESSTGGVVAHPKTLRDVIRVIKVIFMKNLAA